MIASGAIIEGDEAAGDAGGIGIAEGGGAVGEEGGGG